MTASHAASPTSPADAHDRFTAVLGDWRGTSQDPGYDPSVHPWLGFYDHARMGWHPQMVDGEGEFTIRDYTAESGVGPRGEFSIVLHDLDKGRKLTPRLNLYHDGIGALRGFMALDLEKLLAPVLTPYAFGRRLIVLGLKDLSAEPLRDASEPAA